MNLSTSINEKAALIWAIADKLTGVYKPHEYGEVILPLNPPFGREWKNEKRIVEDEAKRGFAGRFGAGLPAASDGQMLF